jgi:hypothetical protein
MLLTSCKKRLCSCSATSPWQAGFEEGKLERQEKPGYPFLAVREAIVNAICHIHVLRGLGFVDSRGHGKSARWWLKEGAS